jgi:hypothetical protein
MRKFEVFIGVVLILLCFSECRIKTPSGRVIWQGSNFPKDVP